MEADQDRDGKISFEEFTKMVENTDVSMSMTLGELDDLIHRYCSRMVLNSARQINSRCRYPSKWKRVTIDDVLQVLMVRVIMSS